MTAGEALRTIKLKRDVWPNNENLAHVARISNEKHGFVVDNVVDVWRVVVWSDVDNGMDVWRAVVWSDVDNGIDVWRVVVWSDVVKDAKWLYSNSVWPDLAKFHHFGKISQVFGNFLMVYLVPGKLGTYFVVKDLRT